MSEIEFGPMRHGKDIYRIMREEEDIAIGDKVRISVPGWFPGSFVTEIVGLDCDRGADSARVRIGDALFFISDRANGANGPGHDWRVEFEVKQPLLPTGHGLYQIRKEGLGIEFADTYRHTAHGWFHVHKDRALSAGEKRGLAEAHKAGDLFRLVRSFAQYGGSR